jgi:hypothetical protein
VGVALAVIRAADRRSSIVVRSAGLCMPPPDAWGDALRVERRSAPCSRAGIASSACSVGWHGHRRAGDHLQLLQPVALKFLLPEVLGNPEVDVAALALDRKRPLAFWR